MKQFYLHDGQQQTGPYSIDELKQKGINRDTPVWKEGMSAWSKAGEIEELSDMLKSTPPPLITPPPFKTAGTIKQSPIPEPKKKKSNASIILLLAVVGTIAAIYFINKREERESISYPTVIDSVVSPRSTEEIEKDLGTIERENPAKYLKVKKPTWRKNLIDEMVLEGSITCNAKIATFKDAVMEVQYYSASNTLLQKEQFTRYETWGNGTEVTFKYKTFLAPKETKQVVFEIVNATPVY